MIKKSIAQLRNFKNIKRQAVNSWQPFNIISNPHTNEPTWKESKDRLRIKLDKKAQTSNKEQRTKHKMSNFPIAKNDHYSILRQIQHPREGSIPTYWHDYIDQVYSYQYTVYTPCSSRIA